MNQVKMTCDVVGLKPCVSVVIPVFNAAAFLHDCIASLRAQTLLDSEFIFVDDGSTDGSRAIIEDYARQDQRIVSLSLPQNLGSFMARKMGVLAARAHIITFLDPDDTLFHDACELFYETMCKTNAAIVHGGMEIINKNNLPKDRIDMVTKMVRPQFDQLEGRAIIQALAIDGKINPGLCGKAFKTSLVKRAYEMIPEGRYRRAQDYLVTFVVCCIAERYISVTKKLYRYGYGNGVFGAVKRDINYYRTICTQVDILPALRSVVGDHFAEDLKILAALQSVEDKFIGGSYSQITSVLDSQNERCEAFSLLLEKVGGMRLIEVLAKKNYCNKENFALILDSLSAVPKLTARPIQKIGIFYYHLTPGGVQRVIATLISIYKKLGCEVVIFLEKKIDESCYDLSSGVRIEYLPVIVEANRNEIGKRLCALADAIARNGIDMMYYHAFLSPNLLWDLLVCKWVCRIPFILHYHTATCYRPRVGTEYYSRWPGYIKIFSFADSVIVLSRADECMFRLCGIRAKYIPNPAPFECKREQSRFLTCGSKEIVWIARFSREKRPSDPVKILSIVRESIPDARLTIVGGGPEIFRKEVQDDIAKLGLSEVVTLAGEQKDVKPYYERASVYLHTSNLEGFPVSLLEAAIFGLPIVMYALPWLEIARDNEGIIQVPQSDLKAAASAIVHILSSTEIARIMSKANIERACKFADYDLVEEWSSILSQIANGNLYENSSQYDTNDLSMLINQITHCYARGILEEQIVYRGCERERLRLSSVIVQQNALRDKLKAENIRLKCISDENIVQATKELFLEHKKYAICSKEVLALKSSEAYRVGMFVTWPARKVYGGIKCLRENGVKYTFKHTIGKVLRKFGSKCKW